jgi:hypothetical protein
MSRRLFHVAAFALLVAGLTVPAQAQNSAPSEIAPPDANPLLPPLAAAPYQPAAYVQPGTSVAAGLQQQPGYVKVGAPMYPSPRPNIPIWTGSTLITNQALAPHEMLYPHTYRAMYPPFYHRVQGKYIWTPLGFRTAECWKLQGTMVEVKYRSHWPKLGGPHPPVISTWGGPWK